MLQGFYAYNKIDLCCSFNSYISLKIILVLLLVYMLSFKFSFATNKQKYNFFSRKSYKNTFLILKKRFANSIYLTKNNYREIYIYITIMSKFILFSHSLLHFNKKKKNLKLFMLILCKYFSK